MSMMGHMRQSLATTFNNAVRHLGELPEEYKCMVESAMDIDNEDASVEIMAMGCHLEDCMKNNSYDQLKIALEQFNAFKESKKNGN